MRRILYLTLVVALLMMTAGVAGAVTPVDPNLVMYASDYTTGDPVDVYLGGVLNGAGGHPLRLNPANALGVFDASSSSDPAFNAKFFALGSRAWTTYTFDYPYWNVDGAPDLEFCEVTWSSGPSWHAEAAKVYLTGAYVRDGNGDVVAYTPAAGEEDGYYAGVAWNRTGIQYVSAANREAVAQSYLPADVTRTFVANTFSWSGVFGWTQFHLPEEVVYAAGVKLVDITASVYDDDGSASTYAGNTDGYDLDAIRAYRYIPWRFNDTATGATNSDGTGSRILPKGAWFMYNAYSGGTQTYPIQAGNPADGTNIIGSYTVTPDGAGDYTVTYDIDDTVIVNGYAYDIVVFQEHLAVSDTLFTSANPGQLDTQDFGVPFADADGMFYIFAHFAVAYQ
jgi:hypothetical protein